MIKRSLSEISGNCCCTQLTVTITPPWPSTEPQRRRTKLTDPEERQSCARCLEMTSSSGVGHSVVVRWTGNCTRVGARCPSLALRCGSTACWAWVIGVRSAVDIMISDTKTSGVDPGGGQKGSRPKGRNTAVSCLPPQGSGSWVWFIDRSNAKHASTSAPFGICP